MLRYTGLALTFFLGIPQAFAHDPFILDSRRPTPGPRLELSELPAGGQGAGKKYRLHVEPGLPRGVVFGVFTKPFDHAFHEVQRGFQLDESGSLVSTEGGAKQRLDDMTFGPGPYPLGAAWEVALVSSDREVRIFAKTIPYPITADDGPCKLSLQLASSSATGSSRRARASRQGKKWQPSSATPGVGSRNRSGLLPTVPFRRIPSRTGPLVPTGVPAIRSRPGPAGCRSNTLGASPP